MESLNARSQNSEKNKMKDYGSKKYNPSEFKIEPLKKENAEDYMAFMNQYFWTREQLSKGCHVSPDESAKMFDHLMKLWLASEASTCAIHIPTHALVGIQLNHIVIKENAKVYEIDDTNRCSENMKTFLKILEFTEEAANVFEDPNVQKVLEIAATAVHPNFVGNKLAFRLAEESEKLGIEKGCQMITSHSTNKITQHIRKKMGMETFYIIDYTTFELNGKKVVDTSILNGTTEMHVMKKYLKKK